MAHINKCTVSAESAKEDNAGSVVVVQFSEDSQLETQIIIYVVINYYIP